MFRALQALDLPVEDRGESRHAVHFYDTDAALADRVADFIGAGLREGGTAILVATEAHLRMFEARLDETGCGVAEARASERLILFDANQFLEKLTRAVPADDPRFRDTVGAMIAPLLAGLEGKRLRVYGEMVDLLWHGGHHQAALWLEEAWNDLAKTYEFELLCTYALAELGSGPSGDLIDICDRHTHVVTDAPAPPAAPGPSDQPTRLLIAEITHRREVERVLGDCARHLRLAEQRERDRSRRNLQLQAATARLAAALTQEDVCTALLSIAEDVLQASAGIVYLRGSDGELHLRASRGLVSPERFLRLPRNVTMPLTTAVEERHAVLLSTRRELLEHYPHLEVTQTPASDLQAIAALPLIHGSTVLGGFAVSFASDRTFDDDERLWLDSIAVQAALAADRARLYEAEKRAREEAETLYRIGESLNATQLDLETIVQRVTDEATKLTGAEFGAFFHNVPGETGESFQLYTLSGAPKETFANLGLPRKTPLFAPTFAGRGVVRVGDVRTDPRYGQLAPRDGTPGGMPHGHLPVVSYLAVPVTSRSGEVLGALLFGHSQPERFTAEHERLTKSLAAAAALAVDNANLYGATRRAEADQRQLNDELREIVHVNELFVAVLAHDLRSPLAAMLTAADLIQLREPAGVESRHEKALLRLTASGHRMTRMIEQLLDFTRLRIGGGLTLVPRAADLGPLVHQVADELEGSATGHGIEIAQMGDGTGCWDTDRLGQVFSNLLANALQHGGSLGGAQAPGKVHVQLDGSLPDTVRVSVHNAGAIAAELIPRIFDPMIAGDRRRDGSRGLGLGLFITQRIVEAHGGSVGVVSAESTGTTFTVTLPRFAKAASVGISAAASRAQPRARKETPPPLADPWHESDARFRLLVDAVKDYAIFMLDPKGHVVTWNEGAKRIKGYEASEIIGQHFSRFYDEPQKSDGTCDRELEIAVRDRRFEDEGWRVRKDGSRFWANVVITPLRDRNDQLVGFTKVTRDLTDRRRLQDEQLRAAKAEEAVRVRDEFLSLVSHELKTPLTILQMQLDTLPGSLGDPSDQKVAIKLGRAAESSGRLARLIDSLMDVAAMATGRFVLNVQRFDLGESLRRVVDYLAPAATRARCEVSLHTEGDLIGQWDQLRLEQAVINLISNALKYGFGKPIQLRLRRQGEEVWLDVRDHGPGIPAADLDRIFGRFERTSSSLNSGGLGLGLYFIHEIAAAHGGSITVQNIPGEGACFQLRLPVRPPAAAAVRDPTTTPKGN
jgi:PAS domain S-box-containing protein